MGLSWSHILIAMLVFALLFGTGKISALMGDVAKGIKSFKKGLTEEWEDEAKPEVKVVDYQDGKTASPPPVGGAVSSAVRALESRRGLNHPHVRHRLD
jgi:sec-independent protein translocase protein TatA